MQVQHHPAAGCCSFLDFPSDQKCSRHRRSLFIGSVPIANKEAKLSCWRRDYSCSIVLPVLNLYQTRTRPAPDLHQACTRVKYVSPSCCTLTSNKERVDLSTASPSSLSGTRAKPATAKYPSMPKADNGTPCRQGRQKRKNEKTKTSKAKMAQQNGTGGNDIVRAQS